jgi:hypothetical protein
MNDAAFEIYVCPNESPDLRSPRANNAKVVIIFNLLPAPNSLRSCHTILAANKHLAPSNKSRTGKATKFFSSKPANHAIPAFVVTEARSQCHD